MSSTSTMSVFAETIYQNKYAHQLNGVLNRKEVWAESAARVAHSVMDPYLPHLAGKVKGFIEERKLMPGGRYMASAGRKFPQVNNCVEGGTEVITDRGVKTLKELADAGEGFKVLNRHGEWEQATAESFGRQKLHTVDFKRGTVRATMGHRWCTSSGGMTTTADLRKNFLEGVYPEVQCAGKSSTTTVTWIDPDGVEEEVYCCVVPGTESFTLANGVCSGNCFLFSVEDSREGWAGLMSKITNSLMTGGGIGVVYSKLRREGAGIGGLGGQSTGPCALMQMVNESGRHIMQGGSRRSAIWAGLHWHHPDVFRFIKLKDWPESVKQAKEADYNAPGCMDGTNISVILDDDFFTAYNDPEWVMHYKLGGENYRVDHNWACDVYWQVVRHMLMTGEPGFSVDIGDNAGEHLRNAPVHGDTKVLTLNGSDMVSDLVGVPTSVWTGRQWAEGVVFKKTGSMVPTVRVRMSNDRSIVCDPTHPFILTDGSRVAASDLRKDDSLITSMPDALPHGRTKVLSVTPDESADVYCANVGVEEHSFCAEGVLVSNCTEVSSRDDEDMCNLASINMSRIDSLEEMAEVTEAATAFLMCGTLYSKLPTETMYRVREKNRRLGLGLMGVHEWLLRRGKRYEPDDELGQWLGVYARSGSYANRYADKLSISRPVATRAVAPTGTISIVAETTSGIEPIYAVAFKRRYLDGKEWKAQYVIDATAERLIADGVDHNLIEDAVSLAEDVERRMKFQSWIQTFTDMGISSTINLPPWGSELNNESKVTSFGHTLLKYLPQLRGITAYPDGSRGGQPLTRVPYEEARGQVGVEFVDNAEMGCKSGVCGS